VASAPATDASNTSVSGHARPVPAPSTPRSALLHRRCRRRPLLDVIGQAPLLSGDDNVTAIAPPPGYGYHSRQQTPRRATMAEGKCHVEIVYCVV
jgi:hypothetical protein